MLSSHLSFIRCCIQKDGRRPSRATKAGWRVKCLSLGLLCVVSAILCKAESVAEDPINLAAGKLAIFDVEPTYPHCKGTNDVTDLTDGLYVKIDSCKMSTEAGTVGWRQQFFLSWMIDLGSEQCVGALRYHVGAGLYGSYWPLAIYVLGSDDGQTFHYLGELMKDNAAALPEYNTQWANRWLLSGALDVKARFIRFMVKCDGMFHFVDEVEIFQGQANACQPLQEFPRVDGDKSEMATFFSAKERVEKDLALLETRSSGCTEVLRKKMAKNWKDYLALKTTVAPMNRAQTELLQINGELLRQSGFRGLVAWTCNAWDPVDIFTWPTNTTAPRLDVYMLRNERRGRVLNLTNTTKKPHVVRLTDDAALPVTFYEAVCMDSQYNFMNCNMLRPTEWVMIPPGATAQLWLEFDTTSVETNLLMGSIQGVEVTLHIANADAPRKFSTHLGLFDYINNLPSIYPDINTNNISAAMAIIEKYKVNTIWGNNVSIPMAEANDFSDDDELIRPLDYTAFDQWVHRFRNADTLALFNYLGAKGIFAGMDYRKDPERFRKRVSTWLGAWMAHVEHPEKIMLSFVDEAGTPELKATFDAWAEALRAAPSTGGRFQLYFNPRIPAGENQVYAGADILSPAFSHDPAMLTHFRDVAKQRTGGQFGFYSCSPNSRELDPYSYYALPFRYGTLFSSFYGFDIWDMVSAPNSLNEYASDRMTYSPLYFDGDKIYPSKQLEATYEARMDYEYFQLLRRLDPTNALLSEIPREIADAMTGETSQSWSQKKDRDSADQQHRRLWDEINLNACTKK